MKYAFGLLIFLAIVACDSNNRAPQSRAQSEAQALGGKSNGYEAFEVKGGVCVANFRAISCFKK